MGKLGLVRVRTGSDRRARVIELSSAGRDLVRRLMPIWQAIESAAEAVAYNLQALGRAIVVGEVTGGGAHPFEYRCVHTHFVLDLPEGRSIHPITNSSWHGVGVKPDIEVPADQALDRALAHARGEIAKR